MQCSVDRPTTRSMVSEDGAASVKARHLTLPLATSMEVSPSRPVPLK